MAPDSSLLTVPAPGLSCVPRGCAGLWLAAHPVLFCSGVDARRGADTESPLAAVHCATCGDAVDPGLVSPCAAHASQEVADVAA